MCFTCFSCQFVFNKRFLKIYCLSVHRFFLVSFTSMYTTLKIISRKFLGVSLIWTFFSHVGAIFFKQPLSALCGPLLLLYNFIGRCVLDLILTSMLVSLCCDVCILVLIDCLSVHVHLLLN